MRLFLDAHLSGKHVALPLRERGFDVFCVDEERSLDGADDHELMSMAAKDNRVLVTSDVKDFSPIAREWAEAEKPHAGLIIIVGLATNEFGAIIQGLEEMRSQFPDSATWNERVVFLSR